MKLKQKGLAISERSLRIATTGRMLEAQATRFNFPPSVLKAIQAGAVLATLEAIKESPAVFFPETPAQKKNQRRK